MDLSLTTNARLILTVNSLVQKNQATFSSLSNNNISFHVISFEPTLMTGLTKNKTKSAKSKNSTFQSYIHKYARQAV